jgi:glycosyltransferase involved in cell wall biosynthesis
MTFTNVHACLVHEAPECVVDLVHNLKHLDPSSTVLLYDGSAGGKLLEALDLSALEAVVHPSPRPMTWGYLHGFALDCLRHATTHLACDALTVVDSDQLALRTGYAQHLQQFLARHPRAGLLGSRASPLPRHTRQGPAAQAWKEMDLWRPWLDRFPNGVAQFPHWTFWPTTVITAAAGRALVQLLDEDQELQSILACSQLWAVEEVLFPTLVALLGYEVVEGPASRRFVRFRARYVASDVDKALSDPEAFFIHPVPRRFDDRSRAQVREAHHQYRSRGMTSEASAPRLLQVLPLLARMRTIDGWFAEEEGDLLLATARQALLELGRDLPLVEIGSYFGRSTVLLGEVARVCGKGSRVVAIDPHQGVVGARGQKLERLLPSYEVFRRNIAAAGLSELVEPVQRPSQEVTWKGPIALLLIDGLHDYQSVARDFHHFDVHLPVGGYVAFHDYASYYPGVRTLVDEVASSGLYDWVAVAGSLAVLRKLRAGAAPAIELGEGHAALVSCLMPTRDRRAFVPRAIDFFLAQDYPHRELVIVDDGADPIADLVPDDPRIRYLRIDQRLSVGTKRNLACEQSRGSIMAHWDDDDWSAPQRLSTQVERLLASDAQLCGLKSVLYYDSRSARAWRYRYSGRRPWVAGGTFCYRRELWRSNPFPDQNVGEDNRFVWSPSVRRVAVVEDDGLYVAEMHASNISPKRTVGRYWKPVDVDVIRQVTGSDWSRLSGQGQATSQSTVRHSSASTTCLPGPIASRPLVSCVMPTRDRPRWVERAIRYFERQDYPALELVIIDDGRQPLELGADERIRHLVITHGASLGAKRNLGVREARGEIIVHWDDDDWSAPQRISQQVAPLAAGTADICGFVSEVFVDVPGACLWQVTPALHRRLFFADVHGRSIGFRKAVWERGHHYPDRTAGEDVGFLRVALCRARLVRIPGVELFGYVRHPHSSWRLRCGTHIDESGWRQVEPPPAMELEDVGFYCGDARAA